MAAHLRFTSVNRGGRRRRARVRSRTSGPSLRSGATTQADSGFSGRPVIRPNVKRTVPRLDGLARSTARDELIGLPAKVVESRDPGLVGLSGLIVDETLRTLVFRLDGGRTVRLGKRESTFELTTPKGPVRVFGAAIEFRPEDRTKKVR